MVIESEVDGHGLNPEILSELHQLRWTLNRVYSCSSSECENLRSLEEFLEKRFPDSRRKGYYLMAIHEHLPRISKPELRLMGWTKARELVKVARREGAEV